MKTVTNVQPEIISE